jgi:hypothetical protein
MIMIDQRAPAPSARALPDSMGMHPIVHAAGAGTPNEIA